MPASKRPESISVDFTGVDIRKGKRSDHVPEGDYLLEAFDYEMGTKKDDPSTKMIIWEFHIVEPKKYAGKRIVSRNSMNKEALWSLRSLMAAMLGEEKVPQSSLSLPLAKIVAKKKQFGALVTDNDYNPEKVTSQVSETYSAAQYAERAAIATGEDIDEDDEDDEDDVKSKATSADDDEDMDEIDVDDV